MNVAYNAQERTNWGPERMYRWARKHFRHASRTVEPTVGEVVDPSSSRQADYDEKAAARRDQRAVDEDSAAAALDRAARDRESTANDAGSATGSSSPSDLPLDDQGEDIRLIGQAQGMIMEAHDLPAAEALLALYQRANTDGTDLRTAARRIVDERAKP